MKAQLKNIFENDFSGIRSFTTQVIAPIFGTTYREFPIAENILRDANQMALADKANIVKFNESEPWNCSIRFRYSISPYVIQPI